MQEQQLDSYYDSEGEGGGSETTTLERPSGRPPSQPEDENVGERQRHDSAEVDGRYSIVLLQHPILENNPSIYR